MEYTLGPGFGGLESQATALFFNLKVLEHHLKIENGGAGFRNYYLLN